MGEAGEGPRGYSGDGGAHALVALSPREAGRRLAADPRLILAVGTLDPLGDDLPLGAGLRVVEAVTREFSETHGILRAPAFTYGGLTKDGAERAGTAGLQRKTLHRAVNDLLGAWEDHGVEEFILITAQRSEPHMDALLMAFTSEARTTVFDLLSLDIADLTPPEDPLPPGGVEARVLAHLDRAERYSTAASPTPASDPEAAASGAAILQRWVELLQDAVPPGRGPAPSKNV